MIRSVLLALLSLWAAVAGAADVPLRVHGRMLLVEATLNDNFTGWFLLDTGASFCALSQETAKKANIRGRHGGKKIRLNTAGGPIEATLGEARMIEAGTATARDVEVAILAEEPVPGFAGLLGLSFLKNFKYSVDTEKGVLRLSR